jgi:hypothetical protein
VIVAVDLEPLHPRRRTHLDPETAQHVGEHGAHLGVECPRNLLVAVDDRDRDPTVRHRLRHLEPDVAAADDDGVVVRMADDVVAQHDPVADRLDPEDPVGPGVRQRRAARHRAGRDHELVERLVALGPFGEVPHRHAPLVGVDPDDFVAHVHVDVVRVTELFGGARDQCVDRVDDVGDVVRQPAGGVRRVVAALERDDLEVVDVTAPSCL